MTATGADQPPASGSLTGKKILIVDDDDTLRESLSEQLQLHEEFATGLAENAREALDVPAGVLAQFEEACATYYTDDPMAKALDKRAKKAKALILSMSEQHAALRSSKWFAKIKRSPTKEAAVELPDEIQTALGGMASNAKFGGYPDDAERLYLMAQWRHVTRKASMTTKLEVEQRVAMFSAWEEIYRMSSQSMTFGRAIAAARKAKGFSQKELAALVMKEEGEGCISPQYLNDIEHDRRSPTSDHLIRQFARVLDEDEGYLFVLAGKIPDDLRERVRDREKVVSGFADFRKNISGR